MDQELERIGKKIADALRGETTPPLSMVSLAFWLGKTLTPQELDFLNDVEVRLGEDEANKWLVARMLESGHYESTDGEQVVAL